MGMSAFEKVLSYGAPISLNMTLLSSRHQTIINPFSKKNRTQIFVFHVKNLVNLGAYHTSFPDYLLQEGSVELCSQNLIMFRRF